MMKQFLFNILLCTLITAAISLGLRVGFDYFGSIKLVDYIAFSGLVLLGLSMMIGFSSGLYHEDHQSSMTFRALITRDDHEDNPEDHHNRISCAVILFISGVLFLLTSLMGYFWDWW